MNSAEAVIAQMHRAGMARCSRIMQAFRVFGINRTTLMALVAKSSRLRLILVGALVAQSAWCGVVIDFESFVDGDVITNQIPGLTFTNAQVATAGISLNEFDFPPHSGTNVVFDIGGPITISFESPVLSFGAYFTYLQRLSLAASGPAVPPTSPVFSKFSNNTGTGGDPGSSPNEFLEVSFPGGITTVSIMADPAGSSFTMDDATFTPGGRAPVPEPASAFLAMLGLTVFCLLRRAMARA
jgi:PEP-CTERM motif